MAISKNRDDVTNGIAEGELLGQSAYKSIRGLILEKVIRPGEQLVEAKLAQSLGMSRTPIRDALSRLEREGLVVSVPKKGTFVESMSPLDIADKYDIREMIEGLAARLLARNITRGDADILEELAAKADDPSATVHHDLEFHSAIIEMCGSPNVPEVVGSFCLHAMIYDERTGRLAVDGDTSIFVEGWIVDAHRLVANAIISGDPAAAEEAMRQHIRYGKSVVMKDLLGLEDER